MQALVVCEDCGSHNPSYHQQDCPQYQPITAAEIDASLLKEPERDRLRIANTTQALRHRVEVELALNNGHANVAVGLRH